MSSLNNNKEQRTNSNHHRNSAHRASTPSARISVTRRTDPYNDSTAPLSSAPQGTQPRHVLPPPLPPVQRGSATPTPAENPNAVRPPSAPPRGGDLPSLVSPSRASRTSPTHGSRPPQPEPQQPAAPAAPSRSTTPELQSTTMNTSASARRLPANPQSRSTGSTPARRRSPSVVPRSDTPAVSVSRVKPSADPSKKTSSGEGSDSTAGASTHASKGNEGVEELMNIPSALTKPIEKFFLEYSKTAAEREDDGQPRNDNEVLLEQFAEYTDDDSFFSSGETVIECDPQRLRSDPLRPRAVVSVHNTLRLRALTNGRVPEDTVWQEATRTSWLYQIHNRAIALQYSSFYVFPARWTPRVMVYNILHHWLMEMFIFLTILGYAIFQATWSRTPPRRGAMTKPDHMVFADVFYTILLGLEIIARLFAVGCVLHKRAFFRSPWHTLDMAVFVLSVMECTQWPQMWNFTAWRLIRAIKCLTHTPAPARMKLLAKSLLRSTNRTLYVTIVLTYFIFFFGLLGLQLFGGTLHSRCISTLTGVVTSQLCRSVSTGQYWFYWGHRCEGFLTCGADGFPNPHYGFRSFDDIGHAMLSVFQIITFQGWSELLQETNDGLAVMAILYYAFTIIVCTWIVPSLYLGVFVEKIEKTSRLFVLKQLDFFDRMLTEQRQRMSAMVHLHDYVERDANGLVSHYPTHTLQRRDRERLADGDTANGSRGKNKMSHQGKLYHRAIQATKWTDEQRVQLHLALTRQRDVAEEAERKRRLQNIALGDLIVKQDGTGKRLVAGKQSYSPTRAALAAKEKAERSEQSTKGLSDFALGGRVGDVQHHPAAYAIGESRQTDLPFAARQEVQAERLRFLDPYTNGASTTKSDIYNSAAALPTNNNRSRSSMPSGGTESVAGAHSCPVSSVRPPLSAPSVQSTKVTMTRETAGVVPNRRLMSARPSLSRVSSMSGHGSVSRLHASMTQAPQPTVQQERIEYVINDPEGGDFKYAKTFSQKVNIIRNIAHMFTEGYPRIISQYLWEHRMMQYRYGLSPLSYTNKYEEEALRRLRQRRAQERREEREQLRRSGIGQPIDDSDDDDDADDNFQTEKSWMRKEGLVPGSMSSIRMARNICENAPITGFNYVMYFLIIANAVFNASRFDTMPDFWEMGTFIASVCFSVLFVLELLIRLFALGPGPFLTDVFILIETTFVTISLFQLGWSRANTTSLFNWVRFLRLFRVISCRPLRRVTRVLIHVFPDIVCGLVLFTIYMFMWLLLGMSFFGNPMSTIDYSTSDYTTRGRFDTFSHAAYAVAQAFSVNREQWLYLSWSGMRARGGYTVIYFIATVLVAFIFRYFLIAVMTYAWQAQQEEEDSYFMSSSSSGRRSRFARLPFFDFSVWRSFKHIHGGFARRDVAPDEIYFLNEDMVRQLHLVEAKDRYYRENYSLEKSRWDHVGDEDQMRDWDVNTDDVSVLNGPQYVNIGGRLYRQPSLPATEMGFSVTKTPPYRGQLGFARQHHAVPATTHAVAHQRQHPHTDPRDTLPDEVEGSQSPSRTSRWGMVNPLRHRLSPVRQETSFSGPSISRVAGPLADEQMNSANITLAPRLTRLGNARSIAASADREGTTDYSSPEDGVAEEDYQHLLLPGPRLRYKSTMKNGRRVFETCLDCNTYIQMPLRAPLGVAQRTAEMLHAEHCHMATVRSSQQLVLNALIGYARMQADHEVVPTKRMVETVLGQAWSCGMLLFDTIENLSCMDLPEGERTWNRMLEALELQQWLLGLHVGEEQVGRATLAYILAQQQKQEIKVQEKSYKDTWKEHSFFFLAPSNPVRRTVSAVVGSTWFEMFILFVIFLASVLLAIYVPAEGSRDMGGISDSGKYVTLHALDDIISLVFAAEMLLKWISMGVVLPVGRAYFWHRWNTFDFVIVVISLASFSTSGTFLRYLKVMRCFRILGPLRYWKWGSSSMSLVARTIWDSVPTLANVCLLMLMNYIVWAILFVSMFMNKMNYCSSPTIVNATECIAAGFTWAPIQRNFRNFYESLLTTFEISTGAEWLDVMYSAVDSHSTLLSPVTNRHPYLGLVFIAYYYVSHFILFTLFMSAVIYCYMLAKSATEDAMGTTIEHKVWLRMQGMILRLKPKAQLLPMNNPISRRIHIGISSRWFDIIMGVTLILNMLTMALEWYHMNDTQKIALDTLQYIWVAMFTLEVVLRITAHGLRFFTRWAYCWDLLIVLLSYLQIGLSTTATNQIPFNVNVLRMLRVGRIVNLVGLALPFHTHIDLLCEVLKASVSGLISVTFVYVLAVYVFAILGLHFLGYIVPFDGYIDDKYNNFSTFVNALIMVFRLSTLQNWAAMLRGSLDRGDYCTRPSGRCGPTNWAPVYYVAIVICFFLLLSTLYMAVALDKYIAAVRMHSAVTRLDDLRRFCHLWSKKDPNATMWLPSAVLPELFEQLRLPLGISDRRNRIEVMRLLREYNIPDHNGRVYYYEVLMPLARRVMAIAFIEAEDADKAGSQTPKDIARHLSERSLGALPASYRKIPPSNVTVAEQYAATLLQAAFRRDRAMRNLYIAKSNLWRRGRALCAERGLPYKNFGFGKTSLDGPDPREEGIRRGFNIPKDASPANYTDARIYADPATARLEAMRETINSQKRAADQESTVLPAVYRSAINHDQKRFGPDAPSAIRRHERRDDKLGRMRAQEALQRHLYENTSGGSPPRMLGEYSDHDYLAAESSDGVDLDVDVSYSGETMRSQPPARGSQYNLDPTDVNYQPPLGTSPEELRQEEFDRRLNAAATTAATSALFGGIPPSTTSSRH